VTLLVVTSEGERVQLGTWLDQQGFAAHVAASQQQQRQQEQQHQQSQQQQGRQHNAAEGQAQGQSAQLVSIVCGKLSGQFNTQSQQVQLQDGSCVSPWTFEKLGGMAHKKKWKVSLHVVTAGGERVQLGRWLDQQGGGGKDLAAKPSEPQQLLSQQQQRLLRLQQRQSQQQQQEEGEGDGFRGRGPTTSATPQQQQRRQQQLSTGPRSAPAHRRRYRHELFAWDLSSSDDPDNDLGPATAQQGRRQEAAVAARSLQRKRKEQVGTSHA
jgi:hypothetical protein